MMDLLNRKPWTMALTLIAGWCLAYYVCIPK